MANITQIPAPRVAIVDGTTGLMSVQWFRYFNNINTIAGGGSGIVPPISGGTGTDVVPTNGQILIGNSSGTYTVANLTAGTGLFRINGSGALTVGISDTGVTAGSYGSASSVTTLTVNAQGQLTVAGNVAIAIDASQITSGTINPARISGSYTGITGVGTLTVGTWNATTIGAAYGGTGLSSYVIGDIIFASGTTALSRLADVATGNALLSGGVGVAPAYGKVGLTTHVSGVLPIANGGTGQITRQAAIDALAGAVTSGLYLRGDGTNVIMSAIQAADVPILNQNTTGTASNVTGVVAVANGGTGLATLAASRIPYGNNTSAYQSSANLTYDGSVFTAKADIVVDKTITAAATTGAQTINKTAGSVNFAALAASLVVTNSLVTTSSVILATIGTNDSTMKSVSAVAAAGSFTLFANAAATAETRVNFLVLN